MTHDGPFSGLTAKAYRLRPSDQGSRLSGSVPVYTARAKAMVAPLARVVEW